MSRRTCEHMQDDGLRCSNPAMYRRRICFHHWRLLRPSSPVCDPAFVPPTFDCEASVSLMTAHILRCVLAGKIDLKRAQVAMSCVRETAKSLRLQGKAGDQIETSFTAFMADYYSTLDEIQAKSAAAYPDPQPLIYPAHFADLPEEEMSDEETEVGEVRAEVNCLGIDVNDVETEMSDVGTGKNNNVGTGVLARAARAQLAVFAAAPTTSNVSSNTLSSRASVVGGDGSASSAGEQSIGLDNVDTGFQARVSAASAAENHHDRLDHRGRAGLQPRVAGSKHVGALAPVPPAEAPPKHHPLSAHQTKLLKKILRHGPKHPQFHKAARLLDNQSSSDRAT